MQTLSQYVQALAACLVDMQGAPSPPPNPLTLPAPARLSPRTPVCSRGASASLTHCQQDRCAGPHVKDAIVISGDDLSYRVRRRHCAPQGITSTRQFRYLRPRKCAPVLLNILPNSGAFPRYAMMAMAQECR